MAAIPLSSGVAELLQKAEKLPATDFDALFSGLLQMGAGRRAKSLSAEESAILKKIGQPFPPVKIARFEVLEQRREARSLSSEEQKELVDLARQLEKFDAKKLELAAQLAALRNLPLREVVASLGLFPQAIPQ